MGINKQVVRDYDSVDAAYIFEGLNTLRKSAIKGTDKPRWFGENGGELGDYAFMFERSIEAARAIERLIHPSEYDRLAIFAYECLDTDSPLIQMLFDQYEVSADILVSAWCEDQKIRTTQDVH